LVLRNTVATVTMTLPGLTPGVSLPHKLRLSFVLLPLRFDVPADRRLITADGRDEITVRPKTDVRVFVHIRDEGEPRLEGAGVIRLEQAHGVGYRHPRRDDGQDVDVVLVGIHLEDVDLRVFARDVFQD